MGPDIARAEAAIAQLALPAERVRRVQKDAMGYWVLIPPLPSKDETDKVMAALKAQGVSDFSLVTEPAARQNAISLGIFRSEDAAQTLLAAVRNKGFANAVLEPREGFFRQVVFYIREPNDAVVARLATLRAAMPGTEVKAMGCAPQ
jgi:cell division septation protein DedD